MQITGKVVCVYPEKTGTYLGSDYRYVNVVVKSDECVTGTDKCDRFVVKFKNEMLAQAMNSGCLDGSSSYVFTVHADVEERKRNDDSTYAIGRTMRCLNISPISNM